MFPSLAFVYFHPITHHKTFVGFNQIEDQSHERSLAGTVVSHESDKLSGVYSQFFDVDNRLSSIHLFKVFNFYIHVV